VTLRFRRAIQAKSAIDRFIDAKLVEHDLPAESCR